eukprot:m.82686 g.82686  ORF g.82686 m.82686 type:complete len:84 (+) comp14627_c0_seq1:36-287(+)
MSLIGTKAVDMVPNIGCCKDIGELIVTQLHPQSLPFLRLLLHLLLTLSLVYVETPPSADIEGMLLLFESTCDGRRWNTLHTEQ